jgi:hypothetical protein
VKSGHVFVVTGPGKYKTVMGVHFLAGGWWPEERDDISPESREPNSSRLMISGKHSVPNCLHVRQLLVICLMDLPFQY